MKNDFKTLVSVDTNHTHFASINVGSVFYEKDNENYYVKMEEVVPYWDCGAKSYERDIFNAIELDSGEMVYFTDFDEVNLVREIVIKE